MLLNINMSKVNLKAHIDSIHQVAIHKCDKCDKSFSHKNFLNAHVKNPHLSKPTKDDLLSRALIKKQEELKAK